jgi:integrase
MASRARANGEGSIYPHRNGFAAYVWVTKPDGKCCRSLPSPTTLDHIRRVLRAALSQAVIDGEAPGNAAKSVRLPAIRKHKRKAWTSDEARRFLEAAREAGDPLYAAYVLVLVLGLRKGELLGLGWDDVDLEAATVTIDWQIQRVSKARGIERRRTKTASSDATLPRPPICVVALREHRDAAEGEGGSGGRLARARAGRHDEVRDPDRAMEIYTQVTDQQTRDALKRLGESLG